MDDSLQKHLFKQSANFRGHILDVTITIERKIDDFIAAYFCKNDFVANELKEMLFSTDKITIGSKKEVLFLLLNRYHKQFLKDYPKFIDTLERFIPHRNILAHLEIDSSIESFEEHKGFVFKRYKGGKLKTEIYGAEEIEKLTADMVVIGNTLDELIKTTKAS